MKRYTQFIVLSILAIVILSSVWFGTVGFGEAWVIQDEAPPPCGRIRQYIRINGDGPKYNMTILAAGDPQVCGPHPAYWDGEVEAQYYLNFQHFQQWRHLKLYREDSQK